MAASEPSHVELYTDGSCRPNPGPGGWAYILRHPASGKTQERSGAEPVATNQRMELRAVIEGLAALRRPSVVELTSDSQYVLRGLREWMRRWKARGWRKADGKPVENLDLWQRLDELTAPHDVRYHWIKGHSGHPENERCDALANAARESLVGVPGSGAGGPGQA